MALRRIGGRALGGVVDAGRPEMGQRPVFRRRLPVGSGRRRPQRTWRWPLASLGGGSPAWRHLHGDYRAWPRPCAPVVRGRFAPRSRLDDRFVRHWPDGRSSFRRGGVRLAGQLRAAVAGRRCGPCRGSHSRYPLAVVSQSADRRGSADVFRISTITAAQTVLEVGSRRDRPDNSERTDAGRKRRHGEHDEVRTRPWRSSSMHEEARVIPRETVDRGPNPRR